MSPPYSIVMVAACPFPSPRGTPVRIYRMAEALALRGHEVQVVTYHLGDMADRMPFRIHRIPSVATYRKRSPGPSYQKLLVLDALLAARLAQVMRTHSFDLVHAHHYEGLLAALAVQPVCRRPVVFDAHTLLERELPDYGLGLSQGVKRRLGGWLDRSLPRRASHVIAVTEGMRRCLIHGGVHPNRITTVPSGVEWERFAVPGDPFPEGTRRTLIFTGNLASYQGVDLLLRAFQEVRRRRPAVRLLLVSDSPFEPYEPLAAALGVREHIELVPANLERLPAYLAGADIAVNPRTCCPGYPQKLLNYMAAGLPIVSFAGSAPGLRHGVQAWLVRDGDTTAFAEAVVRLLEDDDLAGGLGSRARDYVRSSLSWGAIIEKVEAVYARIVSGQSVRSGPVVEEEH